MKPYDLELDRSAAFLHTTLRGFWDMVIVERYNRELWAVLEEFAALRPAIRRWFVDGSAFPVQDQEVAQAMGRLVFRAGPLHPDRTAITVSNSLQRMQVARRVAHETVQLFEHPDEAMAWLLEDAEDAGSRAA
jgi:hypothetical protein